MTFFTQEDADAVREKFTLFSKFSRMSDGACAIDDMEPQGRFMNVFMTMRNDAVDIGAFTACCVLGDALTMALPEGEWELVQAMITRESGALRIRVRIEKNEIKPNNERQ